MAKPDQVCPRCQTLLALVSQQAAGAILPQAWICPKCGFQRAADPRAAHRGRRESRPI
jgi:DNA-directed RNA polymerase subunit M/transcription elongation factor TFIIS